MDDEHTKKHSDDVSTLMKDLRLKDPTAEEITTTPFRCGCDGIICCRSRVIVNTTQPGEAFPRVLMYFCQGCGLMYDTVVMERRKVENISPMEELIMSAALEANQALEENPSATLEDIGAASTRNFVMSIPPVTKKK